MAHPPGPYRPARAFEILLAALTAAALWVGVETDWLAPWWYVGPVTLPPTALYPVPLAALALGLAVGSRRRTGALRPQRLLAAGFAVVVLSTAAFAVVALNRGSGGVFFAGLPPMLFGMLLSLTVLCGAAVTTGRRAYGSVS